MRIIPAIDIIGGKCVRLTQGDYSQQKIYNEDPLDAAFSFEEAGLRHLHLVDLDGAKAGKVTNWNVVESITSRTNLSVDFGGGIKTRDELQRLFDLGVNQANLGSIAVKNPAIVKEWLAEFGAGKIILSADVRNERIAISGWTEDATLSIDAFLQDYVPHGIKYVACTDINTDGMLSGPNVELYRRLISSFPSIAFIASGGVSSTSDLVALREAGAYGAIVGKAIYEGRISLKSLSQLK